MNNPLPLPSPPPPSFRGDASSWVSSTLGATHEERMLINGGDPAAAARLKVSLMPPPCTTYHTHLLRTHLLEVIPRQLAPFLQPSPLPPVASLTRVFPPPPPACQVGSG